MGLLDEVRAKVKADKERAERKRRAKIRSTPKGRKKRRKKAAKSKLQILEELAAKRFKERSNLAQRHKNYAEILRRSYKRKY